MKTEKKANRTLPQIQMKTKKKKGLQQEKNTFSLNFRSDVHPIQIIGGDADVDHSQTIGRDTAKLLGDLSPIPPLVSAPLPKTERSSSQLMSVLNI